MSQQIDTLAETGAVITVPLNKLKTSPRNARRVPHPEADVEALAASITFKGVLQPPIVEPEVDSDGAETGFFLVTIGEGRRKALALLAKRKVIRKSEPVRCVLDQSNDPHEVSLDENVTRSAMHPADQFEAFARLAEERGFNPEDIGARFGVSAQVVRQRLRLGAVSPKLMALYRDGDLNLDQMMAFAVSEDHARQEQVLEQLGGYRPAYQIKRAMTEMKVVASDRRAAFVGAEAYVEAGGTILRDLFTEDDGGWFENVGLLDRLATEKLAALAEEVRTAEGWKWAETHFDFPRTEGLVRVYPHRIERPAEEAVKMAALSEAYDALVDQWDAVEELPPEVETRFAEIDAALQAYGDGTAYEADEIARGGVFVVLGHDGVPRIERGFVRLEDMPPPEPEAEAQEEEGDGWRTGGGEGRGAEDDAEEDEGAPLSERLILDLTAHRTLALRDCLAGQPGMALAAVTHALAVATFYPPYERASCLEIKPLCSPVESLAAGIADSRAARSIAERHAQWASRMPKEAGEAWAFVQGLASGELLDLLAHCASLTVNTVKSILDRRPKALAQGERLADAVGLDMTAYWSVTQDSYLGRITKAKIAEAVSEAVSPEAAERIRSLKKPAMAAEAEALLAGTHWLPSLLRTSEPPADGFDPGVAIRTQEAA